MKFIGRVNQLKKLNRNIQKEDGSFSLIHGRRRVGESELAKQAIQTYHIEFEEPHTPEISIIMPVYNTKQYIKKSINSILHQRFSDFELILINDGSTDKSLFYCKALAAKDERIKVLDLPHKGVAAARLAGINAAVGNYIGFVDSDDWVEPGYLEHLYKACLMNNADMAICRSVCEVGKKTINMIRASKVLPDANLFC